MGASENMSEGERAKRRESEGDRYVLEIARNMSKINTEAFAHVTTVIFERLCLVIKYIKYILKACFVSLCLNNICCHSHLALCQCSMLICSCQ